MLAAIKSWIHDYVGTYYTDGELADWAASLIADGKIKGVTPTAMRAQLIDVLTIVVFTATAQHSAVNFPQNPDMTYAPAITGAGRQDAPAGQHGQREQQWLAMLRQTNLALEQLNVLYLLGSVHFRAPGDYRTNHVPYLSWFEDPAIIRSGGPLQRFQQALRDLQATIEARNRTRPSYPFLLPNGLPNNINI